ncbi:MAG: family 20 glycosylhydrolase [Cytophagaceae bacterium]
MTNLPFSAAGKFCIFIQLIIIIFLGGCNNSSDINRSGLSVKWRLIENDFQGKGVFKSELILINNSGKDFSAQNWDLYFNHGLCRKIFTDSFPSFVSVKHINGDYFKITPEKNFPVISDGDSLVLPLYSTYVAIKYSDAPHGFYFVFNDNGNSIIKTVDNVSIAPFVPEQITRGKNDKVVVPDPSWQYNENMALGNPDADKSPLIIPSPLSLIRKDGEVKIDNSWAIHYDGLFKNEALYLQKKLSDISGELLGISGSEAPGAKIILLKKNQKNAGENSEAYSLETSKDNGVIITADTKNGAFYGIQSLRALISLDSYIKKSGTLTIPEVQIKDKPGFAYRGVMLDVSRNFLPKDELVRLIDLFAFYKINKITLHLADDEGWRLEIPSLPELTAVGSKRGHTADEQDCLIPSYGSGPFIDKGPGNGFYTTKDFIDILSFARDRHIEIIPEIDVPGHARAAIKSMKVRYEKLRNTDNSSAEKYLISDPADTSKYFSVQQYNDNVICPCSEGIYNFLDVVVSDIRDMYSKASLKLNSLHIGGDEVPEGVWKGSPLCAKFLEGKGRKDDWQFLKSYFFSRSVEVLKKYDVSTSAYEDIGFHKDEKGNFIIAEDLAKNGVRLYSWNNVWGWGSEDYSYRLANAGFPVVLGHVTNLYFDLAYNKSPDEPGQYWGGLNDTRKGYEYVPLNIYHSAYYDIDGNEIDFNSLNSKVRLTQKGRQNILGIQGLLFSETLKNPAMFQYYLFPKMLGLAERAWSPEPYWAGIQDRSERLDKLNNDWSLFATAIGSRELSRLDYLSKEISYHIPFPGAVIKNDTLYANSSFPGLVIRYTTDGSDPGINSLVYTNPVEVKSQVKLACFTATGKKGKIVTIKP